MEFSWLETRWARPFYLAFVFCLALGLLQAIKLYLRRQRLLRDLRPFPTPPTHWFFGHQKFIQDDNMEKLEEIIEKYPRAFPLWIGPFQAFFYICDPDYAKTVLNRTDPKSQYVQKFLSPLIGKGLVALDGPKWFQHRRLLTPAFHFNILKAYIEVMTHSVKTMLDKWEKVCSTRDTTVEVYKHINLMSLDIIMKCTFSKETNCQTNSTHDPYEKAIFEVSRIVFQRLYSFLHHSDIIFKLSPQGHRFQKLNQVLYQYTDTIIQDRKKSLQTGVKQDNTQKRKYQDFLDIVLSAKDENGSSFSDTDVHSEVSTFLLAGHDSVAASISWVLYCLAQNPEHQERCREEVRGILGDGSSITWEHLSQMPYTTMCIKECLRLYPPAPNISRLLDKPITFPDGRSLPAGITLFINIWALHHNPYFWEDPEVFNPLRFSRENSEKIHPYAFIPFSAGSRNCIGQHFAIIECKVAVALTLLRFELASDHSRPPQLVRRVVLKSNNGVHIGRGKGNR
uniref:Cytochrome P450 family 4 subfamily X member 1 n=1 Tax=Callithrix jacchus TaxID=9483 RepID=A0A8I4A196_CALJA